MFKSEIFPYRQWEPEKCFLCNKFSLAELSQGWCGFLKGVLIYKLLHFGIYILEWRKRMNFKLHGKNNKIFLHIVKEY